MTTDQILVDRAVLRSALRAAEESYDALANEAHARSLHRGVGSSAHAVAFKKSEKARDMARFYAWLRAAI